MRVALYEPEIAGNVGAVLRLGACLGVAIDQVSVTRHAGFAAFRQTVADRRLVLFSTGAVQSIALRLRVQG